jgi:hypothetical protein
VVPVLSAANQAEQQGRLLTLKYTSIFEYIQVRLCTVQQPRAGDRDLERSPKGMWQQDGPFIAAAASSQHML